MRKTQV